MLQNCQGSHFVMKETKKKIHKNETKTKNLEFVVPIFEPKMWQNFFSHSQPFSFESQKVFFSYSACGHPDEKRKLIGKFSWKKNFFCKGVVRNRMYAVFFFFLLVSCPILKGIIVTRFAFWKADFSPKRSLNTVISMQWHMLSRRKKL